MGGGTLNGAYHGYSSGTPLPPPAVHEIRRSRGSAGCYCCLLCHFLRIVIAVGVAVGVAALLIWLVVRPTKPRFHVEGASISGFNLTGGTLDAIHVRLNITSRNPSKKMGIYYHSLRASAYYRDQRIAWSSAFPTFYQPHKNTTVLRPILIGEFIHLPADVSQELSSTYKSGGAIEMNVGLHSRIRLKVGPFKSKRYTIRVKCNLLLGGLNQTTTFGEQKCKVDL